MKVDAAPKIVKPQGCDRQVSAGFGSFFGSNQSSVEMQQLVAIEFEMRELSPDVNYMKQ